jgi:hypothetical protein
MQQANEDAPWMTRRPSTVRIRRERWRRAGIGEYAISVDKSNLPVRERGTNHQLQAARNRRKNLLRPLPDSVRLDSHIALTELQFLGDPLRRVFFFLGHRVSFRQS